MKIFDQIYRSIDRTYFLVRGNEECLSVISELHSASRSLLFSLQHFRSKHHRSTWDPKGCRELNEVLRNGDARLEAGFTDGRMLAQLNLINVYQTSSAGFVFQLENAFGHATDPRKMLKDAIVGGPNGLLYFYENVVSRIIDNLEHDEYRQILNALVLCCTALARKVSSHLKTGNASANPQEPDGSGQNGEGMRTRRGGPGRTGGQWKQNSK
ncbi:hypothetical protein B0H10DRAFT_322297 [Mycena sp. CBHHK59/15]|nr:hypothetical protein B0H10DRAFT_322297 [Mycena sp. CBHHK59/15]